MAELMSVRHVRWLLRYRLHALGEDVIVQNRCVGRHSRLDVGNMRKHFVVDLNQLQCLTGDCKTGRHNGGDGMSIVEGLAARHNVFESVVQTLIAVGVVREIRGRQHRLDAVEGQRLCRVDAFDAGMRVGTSEYEAVQHAGHVHIGTETGLSGHLVDAIGTKRSSADDLELLAGPGGGAILWHNVPPPSAAAFVDHW